MAKPAARGGGVLLGTGAGVSHLELNHGLDETVPDPSSTRSEARTTGNRNRDQGG